MTERRGSEPKGWAERVSAYLNRDQWTVELGSLPTFQALWVKFSRVVFLTARGFFADRCTFRASGLTYITILSLVPLLAFAFSVAKGLGAYDSLRSGTIEPFLESTFGGDSSGIAGEETGLEKVREAIEQVLSFVEDTQVSGLGVLGLALLAFTVIKLLGTIEQSFNEIWGVTRARTLIRKVADYLSITVVVPILLVTATGVNSAAQNATFLEFLRTKWHLGPLFEFYASISSVLVMWIGFAFVYLFMPNTKVRIRSALIGGIVGGSLWHLAQVAHVAFQVGIAKYNALYAGFAALPIFMIWVQVSWVTVLLGAEAAHAHQAEAAYHRRIGALRLSQSDREELTLRALVRIVLAFVRGEAVPKLESLSATCGVPAETLDEVFEPLRRDGVLLRIENGERGFALARAPEKVRLTDVLDSLRGWSDEGAQGIEPLDRAVGEQLAVRHRAQQDARENLDLRHFASLCAGDEDVGALDEAADSSRGELPATDGSPA